MFQLEEQVKRSQQQQVYEGNLVSNCMDRIFKATHNRIWDKFIHASKLDWNKDPEKQLQDCMKSSGFQNGYSRMGDLIHDDIHKILDSTISNQAWKEHRFRLENWHFQGTMDRVQFNMPIGNVLFEFKTTTELKKDKPGGSSLLNKIMKTKVPGGGDFNDIGSVLLTSNWFHEKESELIKRMHTTLNEIVSDQKHLTQMFSYVFALQQLQVPIDYACLVYISRDSYKVLKEDWYYLHSNESKQLINRAHSNLYRVVQCLFQILQQAGING